MKRIYTAMILGVILQTQCALGQDYLFRVLANKGRNQVTKMGSSEGINLKTGAKLQSGDEIIAVQGAYIGLVHRSGKTIEVREAGTYSVNKLERKVGKGNTSVTSRYMDFVLSKLSEKKVKGNGRNLTTTGAVERTTNSASIKMLLKETKNANKVLGNYATLRWESEKATSQYLVTIKNIFDQVLFVKETSETKYELDFTQDKLTQERFIIVNVKSKNDKDLVSRDYGILHMSPSEGQGLKNELANLEKEIGENSSLNNLAYASFFEENGLYLEALNKYNEAIQLSPDVQDFQVIYEDFVFSNNLGN